MSSQEKTPPCMVLDRIQAITYKMHSELFWKPRGFELVFVSPTRAYLRKLVPQPDDSVPHQSASGEDADTQQ